MKTSLSVACSQEGSTKLLHFTVSSTKGCPDTAVAMLPCAGLCIFDGYLAAGGACAGQGLAHDGEQAQRDDGDV